MGTMPHMSVVARLRIRVRVLGVESGTGSVTHRICHVVMTSIAS